MNRSRAYDRALEISAHLHRTRHKFSGRFALRYLDAIRTMIRTIGVAESMLDYGCGKGVQYPALAEKLGVVATLYDPAWPAFAAEPEGRFDLVIATQVLGAIPAPDHQWVLERMAGRAIRAVFVGERVERVSRKGGWYRGLGVPNAWTAEQWMDAVRAIAGGPARVFFASILGIDLRLWEVLPGGNRPIAIDKIDKAA